MPKPLTCAKIDLTALCENYRIIREYTGVEVICVSKADSYGHSAELCVPALYRYGARFFAVANLTEAIQLRQYLSIIEENDPADIIILGATLPCDVGELIEHNFIQTLYSYEYANLLASKIPEGKRLRAHVKLDTGMNRLGFRCSDDDISNIVSLYFNPKFHCEGFYSHFACADEGDTRGTSITDTQNSRYTAVLHELEKRGLVFKSRHISNSAAAIWYSETKFDHVRVGIALYGLTPSYGLELPVKLKPVMDFCTTVTHVHTVRAGETISYGATFTAERDITAATLAVGYADGFIRAYRNGYVRVHGKDSRGIDCPIIGRICMDQCICDVSEVPGVSIGDEVTLFGADKPVEELSRLAGTINYESVCLIGKRIPRIAITN